jgi:phosphatidylserine/phosphatidylglycerophosphate/cardiolipin synthase-like enzyme
MTTPTLEEASQKPDDQVFVYYCDFEAVDIKLLNEALPGEKICAAFYTLTSAAILGALTAAASRQCKVRLLLDGIQFSKDEPSETLLSEFKAAGGDWKKKISGIDAKTHTRSRQINNGGQLHMKSYSIGNRALRTGSANLADTGLKSNGLLQKQENDLVVIRIPILVESFNKKFEELWEATKQAHRRYYYERS